MKERVKIVTPNGEGTIDDIFVSELGYLMLRIHFPDKHKWTTYNLGTHDIKNNIFTNIISPNKWLCQYLENEKLYYLTEHHKTDGVITELYFESEKELSAYLVEHNINNVLVP